MYHGFLLHRVVPSLGGAYVQICFQRTAPQVLCFDRQKQASSGSQKQETMSKRKHAGSSFPQLSHPPPLTVPSSPLQQLTPPNWTVLPTFALQPMRKMHSHIGGIHLSTPCVHVETYFPFSGTLSSCLSISLSLFLSYSPILSPLLLTTLPKSPHPPPPSVPFQPFIHFRTLRGKRQFHFFSNRQSLLSSRFSVERELKWEPNCKEEEEREIESRRKSPSSYKTAISPPFGRVRAAPRFITLRCILSSPPPVRRRLHNKAAARLLLGRKMVRAVTRHTLASI